MDSVGGSAPEASAVGASGASATTGLEAAKSPTAAWIQRLEAGQVTREQAIEGLVAHALEAHGASRLSGVHRAELERVLRAALLEDPVLGRLLGTP